MGKQQSAGRAHLVQCITDGGTVAYSACTRQYGRLWWSAAFNVTGSRPHGTAAPRRTADSAEMPSPV